MTETKPSTVVVPPSRMAMAVSVATRVQIQSVRLIESTVRQSLLNDRLPTKIAITADPAITIDAERHSLVARAKLALTGRYKESDKGQPALQIAAEFGIDYTIDSTDGLSQENYDAFAELNGIHNVWPYWREYVQSIVGRMGFPPLVIPVHRVMATGSSLLKAKGIDQPQKVPQGQRKRQKQQHKAVD